MDFLKLLSHLASADTPTPAAADTRRRALSRLAQTSAAALPAALSLALAPPAQARPTASTYDALRLALTLEYLENEFYTRALAKPTSFFGSAATRAAIQTIQSHEQQHVALLEGVLRSSGGTVPTKPNFDFTGSKNGTQAASFPDVFDNFDTFLQVAQLLEDAGVRAYKGQVEFLQADNFLLETALRAHSTEARHAAHIRTLRRQRGAQVKSWSSPTDAPVGPAAVAAQVYANEQTTTQLLPGPRLVPFRESLPINVATPPLPLDAILAKVAEAFDEPLDGPSAEAIVGLFAY
ncbi:ferritin-like domain-containing protein [Hymenobacter weizhouensis]|uniref:ferritin-like domain-containing protein n=1 Tax=Hymenobacter sp. YIM 151500-1 TaxID=2987689 RepID=UPI00222687FA|nr:ferritin-like domain-containing protein [Hymenobacter sp. YIM 151500-1]UYZ63021.1 ferritin-like domain-containing protein [Hymenobacter sp. YIM 151500-1]